MNARGIYTVFGKKWTADRITEILSNEKYIGDAVLQKQYVNNHIEKKLMRNKGELPMYYAECTHEAIINRETFEKAQEVVSAVKEMLRELAKRMYERKATEEAKSVFNT